MRTVSTASKSAGFTRRPTARLPQRYDARATATPARVAAIVTGCEPALIGVLRVTTTITATKMATIDTDAMAYAADSVTTRSTSYSR